MARSKVTPRPKVPDMRRKNMVIDQRKLDQARRVLGVATDTAAVDAALDLVTFRAEVFDGLDHLAAEWGQRTPPLPRSRRTTGRS